MDNFDYKKWADFQSVDLALREVQISFDHISEYEEKEIVLEYNKYIESMRSDIHKIMKTCNKINKDYFEELSE